MSYGLYGFILKPLEASEGQIELFCSDSFGVCGTGLKQEEMTLACETGKTCRWKVGGFFSDSG